MPCRYVIIDKHTTTKRLNPKILYSNKLLTFDYVNRTFFISIGISLIHNYVIYVNCLTIWINIDAFVEVREGVPVNSYISREPA